MASTRHPDLLPSRASSWSPSRTTPSSRRTRRWIDPHSTEPLWGGFQRVVQHPSLPFPMSPCSSLSQTTFEPVMRSHRDAVYLVVVMVMSGVMFQSEQSRGERKRPAGRCWFKLPCAKHPWFSRGVNFCTALKYK